MNQQATAIPALLDLPAHGFNLGADGFGLARLGLLAREVVPRDLESADELGARPRQHLDVGVHLLDLRARRGDGQRLCLDARRLVRQGADLVLPLGAGPGGGHGDRPQLVLRRDELLLERDVRGGEPLVVDEELLDVLVPGDESLLDHREGGVRGGGGRGRGRGRGDGGRRPRPRRAAEEGRVGVGQADDVGTAPCGHRRRRR